MATPGAQDDDALMEGLADLLVKNEAGELHARDPDDGWPDQPSPSRPFTPLSPTALAVRPNVADADPRDDPSVMTSPRPGMIIDGKWELRRLLGSGGFGKVYEAWHLELDRPVAIKILGARHGGAEARRRFRDEARLLAGMSSEHLVRASDYGELPDGSPYFVMDLVEGRALRQHLLRERQPIWRAIELAEEILEGLSEVHARGVIHGDIKPENVIIGESDGKARLLDFGLAQTSTADDGGIGGTAQYMAPEMLLERAQASARTDVYAVGVVLYEMLTGRLPRGHVGMKPRQVIRAWDKRPNPDPVRMHCTAPEELDEPMEALEALVNEALARDPTKRFKSAKQMLVELRALKPRLSPDALVSTADPSSGVVRSMTEVRTTNKFPTVEPRRSAWPLVVVGVLVIAAVAVGWSWGREEAPAVVAEDDGPVVERSVSADDLRVARDGVLIAVPHEGAAEHAVCRVFGGHGSMLGGRSSISCLSVPPPIGADELAKLAGEVGVRVVVLVDHEQGNRLHVRATSHHRGEPLLAKLDGLLLPSDPADLEAVIPVLKNIVGGVGVDELEVPALHGRSVDVRWAVLAEWLRAQQGHDAHEDQVRREQLMRALGEADEGGEDGLGFYRDLAALVWAIRAPCASAEPTLRRLTEPGERDVLIRVAALQGVAECLLDGDDAASRAKEAEAALAEALALSRDHSCVRLAAVGSISRIDHWMGGDALWKANEGRLPDQQKCEPTTWSHVFGVRGDALKAGERWCLAAEAYATSYGALRTNLQALLNWAEYDWKCNPTRGAARRELLRELDGALESSYFARPQQRVSIAYVRWWLGQEPADAERVMEHYARVEEGEVGLLGGVASDLEAEICGGAKAAACSLRILAGRRRAGDEDRLRRSLGLR